LRIADLPAPVTAAKADWLAGTRWLGFTPTDGSGHARERCRAAIQSQAKDGYVLEYVTLKFGDPNPGFETSERYLAERAAHRDLAGRLIAVHRLRPSSRPLIEILGEDEFTHVQDMWAAEGKRYRWSVAFPIVESYSIPAQPYANEVFSKEAMIRLFAHPSGTLRPLNDDERKQIAELALELRPAENAWIAIADETAMAEQSQIAARTLKLLDQDLSGAAMEGLSEEQKRKVRRRAAWLAERFVRERARNNQFICDECGFDPRPKTDGTAVKPRSLLDVHHKNPLDEGIRRTTVLDFALLCPNCHRFVHALIRSAKQAS
jgi:5-methylcytosine-specific restriction protein A